MKPANLILALSICLSSAIAMASTVTQADLDAAGLSQVPANYKGIESLKKFLGYELGLDPTVKLELLNGRYFIRTKDGLVSAIEYEDNFAVGDCLKLVPSDQRHCLYMQQMEAESSAQAKQEKEGRWREFLGLVFVFVIGTWINVSYRESYRKWWRNKG